MRHMATTYTDALPSYTCVDLVCAAKGQPSYHPEDVRQRYCGRCHRFAADIEALRQLQELEARTR
jgi:hypothetical protein